MAAELGEKERAAAFAEPHPLAWIDFDAPVLVASNRRDNVLVTVASPNAATCCAW